MQTIGGLFKRYRTKRKFSQLYCADRIGVSKAYISYVENNLREPSYAFVSEAAKLFDVEVEAFFQVKYDSEQALDRETLKWVVFGSEMDAKGIPIEKIREWVKVVQAFEFDQEGGQN